MAEVLEEGRQATEEYHRLRLTELVTTRWLFGDQLGPHHLDSADQPVLMIEARRVFARRRFHRAKAHLVLSAIRHRAAELGGLLMDLPLARVGTFELWALRNS